MSQPSHPIVSPADPLDRPFLNRDLSWLEFNRRVLHEALDARTPLMERVAFLAIFNSNLDEFYQKRVGGLKRQIDAGITAIGPEGFTPRQMLGAIRETIQPMLQQQAVCYREQIKPGLKDIGIDLVSWFDLTDAEREHAHRYFMSNLFPVLTPLAVDPGHPFPFISNLSTSLGVMLAHEQPSVGFDHSEDLYPAGLQFARVKVPGMLPAWIELSTGEFPKHHRLIQLSTIIHHHIHYLFEGMDIRQIKPFRVTRNADVGREEDDAEDLLEFVEQELRQRRFARVVRLEVSGSDDDPMTRYLVRELDLSAEDVYVMPAELHYNHLWQIHALGPTSHKHRVWHPVAPTRLSDDDTDFFSVIRQDDVLVHHPYESFNASVERFIASAARDPKVVAIKLTLYRTSEDSPFIPALIRAAESGKQVVVLVELTARFDEHRNVQLAQRLEKAGIHVVYGLVGLKTHTKTSLVVRQEEGGMRTYAHIGTGNYHAKTANLYTDLGLFTCDPRLTGDLVNLFHYLTGRTNRKNFDHLLVAPINMRTRFEAMIDREIAHAADWQKRGGVADDPNRPRIIAKMNSLEDTQMCEKLYEASAAGVKIDLIVRGFCCLRPGVPGLSENIQVISVIGRFLEHSRIYYFHNAGEPAYYIGSADWMYRNLNNRVECIAPIYPPAHQARLRQILEVLLTDQRQAWDMASDGVYHQRVSADPEAPEALGTHQRLMDAASGNS